MRIISRFYLIISMINFFITTIAFAQSQPIVTGGGGGSVDPMFCQRQLEQCRLGKKEGTPEMQACFTQFQACTGSQGSSGATVSNGGGVTPTCIPLIVVIIIMVLVAVLLAVVTYKLVEQRLPNAPWWVKWLAAILVLILVAIITYILMTSVVPMLIGVSICV